MTRPRTWRLEAPAKINLLLRVGRRRPDGFHELESLFQTLALVAARRVSVGPGPGPGATAQV